MDELTKLTVGYAFVDGTHIFTAGDKLTKGLCAGNKNLGTALEEAGQQIAKLLECNHGVRDAVVVPEVPVEDFIKNLLSCMRPWSSPSIYPKADIAWTSKAIAA